MLKKNEWLELDAWRVKKERDGIEKKLMIILLIVFEIKIIHLMIDEK
jgi:hypothetical protein